jgi:hypothetical protein
MFFALGASTSKRIRIDNDDDSNEVLDYKSDDDVVNKMEHETKGMCSICNI